MTFRGSSGPIAYAVDDGRIHRLAVHEASLPIRKKIKQGQKVEVNFRPRERVLVLGAHVYRARDDNSPPPGAA